MSFKLPWTNQKTNLILNIRTKQQKSEIPCSDPLKKDEAQAGLPPGCADPGKRLQNELQKKDQ